MAGDVAHKQAQAITGYDAYACADDHVHVEVTQGEKPIGLVFEDADDAYNFAQAILRAYDEAVGITPPGEQ